MTIKKSVCSKLIKNFQLRELFNQLGWNHTTKTMSLEADSQTWQLKAIAEKSAFFVFVCESTGKIPDYATRKKIDSAITKLYHQHLIIYTDSSKRQQVWQLVIKELDKPAVVRETPYYATQEPELLFQKLQHLFFSIDEEDNITVVDVTGKVQGGFNKNAEKVTKKFYEGFKKEQIAFLGFINGISESQDKDWYASLMLNRLMFIYFIQKKGFLNNDKFYLKTKLTETQSRKGKDKFYSFYRNFLLVLFHQGLGSPDNKKLEKEIGKVPYLNGGLFDVHELETTYTGIQIEDKAFERIFDFFDQYEWHLDTRQQATGKEINPDVIGYIFEKYINDRAAMGAYYTKEDITDYIGKNCIIPFLFDELKRNYLAALKKGGDVWSLLQQYPADYIYPAIQHGIEHELPAEIAKGLDDVSKRGEWNKPAPTEYGLPTEIWREVVERRRRYAEVKGKIETGEIHEINDLITYNLNITRFAIDVIQNSSDPELIRHFFKALEKITVLDPTCGSGAFLFAAMNILEPLYEACIVRMNAFAAEATAGKYNAFDDILKRVYAPEHPNLQYYIFKTIILNNLYGVDIMKEAIEIAKLRLFLKLVACVDVELKKPNMGLEPLPDIDFNIRSGNTLVGFVSIDEVKKAVEGQLGFHDKDIASIEEAAKYVKRAHDSFLEVQIAGDATVKEFKKILVDNLSKLNYRLDVYLGKLYGKDPKKAAEYKTWRDSHKPFHWFSEFYEILHDRGGFDIIVGNPPYVEISPSKVKYNISSNYSTLECGNLYAVVTERCCNLINKSGSFSFIVPSASCCTPRMHPLISTLTRKYSELWFSFYDERPGKLFYGVDQQLCIQIARNSRDTRGVSVTSMRHWSTALQDERPALFDTTSYCAISPDKKYAEVFPKINLEVENNILSKIYQIKKKSIYYIQGTAPFGHIYYRNAGGRYWRLVKSTPSYFKSGKGKNSSTTEFEMKVNKLSIPILVSLFSSNLFYWYWRVVSNCRHLTNRELNDFPISESLFIEPVYSEIAALCTEYEKNIEKTSKIKITQNKSSGQIEQAEYYVNLSKSIIDDIDRLLAKHYGLTDEELDFIINYDIKYRMGRGGGDDEEAE